MLLNYIQIEKKLRKNASEIKIAQNATSELISSHCDQMKIEEALFFSGNNSVHVFRTNISLHLVGIFLDLALLSGRKPDLCCTSIIENSEIKKKLECPPTYTLKNAKTSLYHVIFIKRKSIFGTSQCIGGCNHLINNL